MLERSVNIEQKLNFIRTQEEQSMVTGQKPLNSETYIYLLMLSAATRRDSELKLPPQRSRRTIHKASMSYGYDWADFLDEWFVQPHFNNKSNKESDQSYIINVSERIRYNIWQFLPNESKDHFVAVRN